MTDQAKGRRTRIVLWIILGAAVLADLVQVVRTGIRWGGLFPSLPGPFDRGPSPTTYIAAALVGIALLGALYLTITRRWRVIVARFRFEPYQVDNRHLAAFVIYYVPQSSNAWIGFDYASVPIWIPALFLLSPLLALAWMTMRGSFRATLRRDWGLNNGRGVFVEVGWGLAAAALVWSVARLVAFGFGAASLAGPGTLDWVISLAPAAFVVGMVVVAPVVEEAFFRGALHRELRRSLGWFVSALIGAFVFAVAHQFFWSWTHFGQLLLYGFALSIVREWRDSLIAPMVMHCAWNGVHRLARLLELPSGLF